MPKMKSSGGAKKRLKRTGSGGLKRQKAFASHILTKKSRKRKRNLHQSVMIDKADLKRINVLVPYL